MKTGDGCFYTSSQIGWMMLSRIQMGMDRFFFINIMKLWGGSAVQNFRVTVKWSNWSTDVDRSQEMAMRIKQCKWLGVRSNKIGLD